MPLYEYECRSCAETFELIHSFKDESNKPCVSCESTDTFRVIHSPGVVFKGEGFYCNDSHTDAQEAVKRKFEGAAYRTPAQRGDTARAKNFETCVGPGKRKKKP